MFKWGKIIEDGMRRTLRNVRQTRRQGFNNENFKTGKKRSYLMLRLWKYIYQYKWRLLAAFVLSISGNLFALLGPMLSGRAIDAIQPGKGAVNFTLVFHYTMLMLLFYIISAVMGYFLSNTMIKLSRSVVYKMRKDIYEKLTSLPISFFDRHQTGDIISIISYDVDTINASLSNDLVQIVTSVFTVAGSFIMMLTISPKLILVFAATIPASIVFTRYRAKRVRPLYRARSVKLGELNGFVEEMIGGKKTTMAYNREKVVIDKFDVENTEAVDSYFTADYYGSMTGPSMNFINNLSLALISIFGAILYMGGNLSLGSISSFVLYSRKFSGPINEFANIIGELQSAFSAAERVFGLIDEEPEKADALNAYELTDICGKVCIEDVSFGYEPGRPVINNLNIYAGQGSVIAIVGPTGAGKTTIINLLMRFYDADTGTISIDGNDITQVTRNSLRRSFTMVLQDTWLFHGTIFENIAYGKENVTPAAVTEAANAAKIHNYIMSLPKGYDTVLSDNGINISKGQKQLMTIARAMMLDSKMLILDEATSNVDAQTERRIQNAMIKLMKNRTCFVIAHRLSTIKNADMILVVRDGNIVEQGSHSELLRRRGFYHELYNSQYEGQSDDK